MHSTETSFSDTALDVVDINNIAPLQLRCMCRTCVDLTMMGNTDKNIGKTVREAKLLDIRYYSFVETELMRG